MIKWVEPDKAKATFLKDLKVFLEYQVLNDEKEPYGYRYGRSENTYDPVDACLVYRVQPS